MIITRSPLRISLGGGGTDMPSYYGRFGGFVIAGAIDKYVYISLHRTFQQELIIKYSRTEHIADADSDKVEHPLVREALRFMGIKQPHLEITSMADIPAGTGLGSSGSFTTALLAALHCHEKHPVNLRQLAEEACHIEIDVLKQPVGRQDQYIAALGGLTRFDFHPDGRVEAKPLGLKPETLFELEDNLILFFTGYSRAASSILQEQDTKSKSDDSSMIENLHFVKDLGHQSEDALVKGDLRRFADIMNVHWQHKKKRSGSMSNANIDRWYELALDNGALGGKLIGAGGGGFLLFYTEQKARLRAALTTAGLREVRFRFDGEGTKVIAQ
jgi:D-glycero-alpha-D-manno-heptose-7-phosphate kinase